MAWTVTITFAPKPDGNHDWHLIHNFAEAVWRACRDTGWAAMDLSQTNGPVECLTITAIRSSHVRRALRLIEQLLGDEPALLPLAQVSAINTGA